MKTLKITDEKMTVRVKSELVKNVVYRECEETDNYDLIITECGLDGFWKSTEKINSEIELEINDCWIDKDNNLVNQYLVITTIK